MNVSWTDVASAGTTASAHPYVEKEGKKGGAIFVKKHVLLLDLEIGGGNEVRFSKGRLAREGLKRTFMNTFRMKRNKYIVPCKPLKLQEIQGKSLPGVEYVFHVKLNKWEEDIDKKSGLVSSIDSEFVLKIWDVCDGTWKEYGEVEVNVPDIFDRVTFMLEDAAHAALGASSGGMASLTKIAVEVATYAIKAAVEECPPLRLDEKDEKYVYKVKQVLKMAGRKLAVGVAKHKDFRLRSPALTREGDQVAMGVGDCEGVRLSDTYLFTRSGPDDWEGFGRVSKIGEGGSMGMEIPSYVEVISDYDGDEQSLNVLEYPLVGVIVGISSGMLPVRHEEMVLETDDTASHRGLGMVGLSLDVRWRIPWLPINELYQTNRVNYIMDNPILLLTIDPGLEKRWFWGRFAPVVGLRYTLGIVGMPINKPGSSGETAYATAKTHGFESYLGFNFFLHPVFTISLYSGWRQYFKKVDTFTYEETEYTQMDVNGDPWNVNLSGPFVLVGLTYEY